MSEQTCEAGNGYPPHGSTNKYPTDGHQGFEWMRKLQNDAVTGENGYKNKDREWIG